MHTKISEGVLSLVFRCNGTEWRSPAQVKKLVLLILLEIILKEFAVSVSNERSLHKLCCFQKEFYRRLVPCLFVSLAIFF